ncbi:shikimate dehydrogenase [Candidatus Woesearchaeota archaeon]|nr:shikimate dehydrogenase [Candidatus Woesearchaeota archaeon]
MICVPITDFSPNTFSKNISEAASLGDIIELRLDFLGKHPFPPAREFRKKPIIATVRKKSEGGASGLPIGHRLKLYREAISRGAAYVDIELSSPELLEQLLPDLQSSRTKVILSFHDFHKTDLQRMMEAYEFMTQSYRHRAKVSGPEKSYKPYKIPNTFRPEAVKLVGFARTITDNAVAFKILERARKDRVKAISFCMGRFGESSRILCPFFGSWLTYGALPSGKTSAPGQLKADALKDVFRVNALRKPKLFGLIGNPIAQSKGYLFHNQAFKSRHLNAAYASFLVDNLWDFMGTFSPMLSGFSVTIPYKEEIIGYLDRIEPHARTIGAANTVINEGGRLIGYNTDYIGVAKALGEKISLNGKFALVLGAGGIAKAACYALSKGEATFAISNRTFSRAKELAERFGGRALKPGEAKRLRNVDIIINCTSVGMAPKTEKTILSRSTLRRISHRHTLVFDTVHNPEHTRLLKEAESLGLNTVSGKRLFTLQAVEQLHLFTRSFRRNTA